ncbi:ATP-dependent RNA helicase rhlE [Mycobacteroides abscessus]|nr:ATP-dependent RNA helicase rhlE [Mycobacteroides abscessus]
MTADSVEVANLVGEVAPYVKPVPAQKASQPAATNNRPARRVRKHTEAGEGRPARTPRRGGGRGQQRSTRKAGNSGSR